MGSVCRELAEFQNEDGGFGFGLEPDIWIEQSCVYTTTVALRTLRQIRSGAGVAMWRAALEHLMNEYDERTTTWELVHPKVDDIPRPSWWEYRMTPTYFENFLLNPRAEVVGYLYDSGERAHRSLADSLISPILEVLETRLEKLGQYDLHCCIRLAETECLPEPHRTRIRETLIGGMKSWIEGGTQRPLLYIESRGVSSRTKCNAWR